MSTGSTTAVLYIGFTGEELASSQITDYLERVVNPQPLRSQWCVKYRSVRWYEIRSARLAGSSQNGGTKPAAADVMSILNANNYQSCYGQAIGEFVLITAVLILRYPPLKNWKNLVVKAEKVMSLAG